MKRTRDSGDSSSAPAPPAPPAKRKRVEAPSSVGAARRYYTNEDIESLVALFRSYQQQGKTNPTLNHLLRECYLHMRDTLRIPPAQDEAGRKEAERLSQAMKSHDKLLLCHNAWAQLMQLKGQIQAYRRLAHGLKVPRFISTLAHGALNRHSHQRAYVDPVFDLDSPYRPEGPSAMHKEKAGDDKRVLTKHRSYMEPRDLPVLVEELVYQQEANAQRKVQYRKNMLRNYLDAVAKSGQSDRQAVKFMNELTKLEMLDDQRVKRREVYDKWLDMAVYEKGEAEPLLDPDMFARTTKIGLHFEPHINFANHPPGEVSSEQAFPYHYVGNG